MFHNPMKMHYCFTFLLLQVSQDDGLMMDWQSQMSGIKLLAIYSKGDQDSVQRAEGDF